MFDILFTGGRVVDGSGLPWFRADVALRGDRIAAVGTLTGAQAHRRIDVAGKAVAPGFIDAHVHGDLMLLADPLQEPAIRQGVTTYILGQDGVAMAPASPATLDYMRHYTAGFSGNPDLSQASVGNALRGVPSPPTERHGGRSLQNGFLSIAEYLACFDRKCALNVAVLVPNGNVRMEVLGLETRKPTAEELKRMGRLVRDGMEQGALGLSSGLDYIPSRYADTEELIALCREIAPFGGVYVTHMRRYDPDGVLGAMDEVFRIGREAEVPVHISHFNSRADLVLPPLDAARASGIDVTFDLYCYLAGSSILAMNALPPWVQEGGVEPTVTRLRDPAVRAQLRDWFAAPRVPLETIRLSYVASPEYRQFEGQTLAQAAGATSQDLGDFVCNLLAASHLAVGCVVPHRHRTQEDVCQLMRHPAMMAGSDGIFIGRFPHPRGWGCFARYLGHHVRGDHTWTLEQAAQHLSAQAARRFGLHDRGLLRPGMAADVVVFHPETIADHATYEDGRRLAGGVEHVVVNGELVLHNGQRTAALPGRALKMTR
jgi:N-acyl-D-amino-acid deacylase